MIAAFLAYVSANAAKFTAAALVLGVATQGGQLIITADEVARRAEQRLERTHQEQQEREQRQQH